MSEYLIRTAEELESLYGEPGAASIRKEVSFIHPIYQRWIEASPFAIVATSGPDGLDASPRGDPAPLVRILDGRTLLLPERRGNNRIDTLRNLVVDPRISLLFMIPGIGETVRVKGQASILMDPELLQSFAAQGSAPKCVVRVEVKSVYFQCARAMIRSSLWQSDVEKPEVPSAGDMLAAITNNEVGGSSYDKDLPQRQNTTLY